MIIKNILIKNLFNLFNLLLLIINILTFNNAFAITSYFYTYNDIVSGTNEFLKQEILKQHKTVDLDSITIKILNPQTITNKTCDSKIVYYFPAHSNINQKATIIAECKSPKSKYKNSNHWKVYIPVNIKFLANVLSVKTSLPKLHVINKEDLTLKKINVITLKNTYYADLNEVVGLTLKTSIKQNTVLTSNLLTKVKHGT